MYSNVAVRLEQWNDFRSSELEVLVPKALTLSQIALLRRREIVIAQSRATPSFFFQALPMTVAEFRPDIQRDMREWVYMEPQQRAMKTKEFQYIRPAFGRDMEKLHLALFNKKREPCAKLEGEIGVFVATLAPRVHVDIDDARRFGVMYVSRLGKDEIEVIDGSRLARVTAYEQNIIDDAKYSKSKYLKSKQKLHEMRVLRRIPLGDVVLMASNLGGTHHCSRDLRRPSHSGQFRYAP